MEQCAVLEQIRALTPRIRSECNALDKTRTLPDGLVDTLRDMGVYRLLAPTSVGGGEIDPVGFLRVVEETAYADGSLGWCVMISGCYSTFAGLLPSEGAHEIYGPANAISAGAFGAAGTARRVEGGYQVGGRWRLGSGSSHATWFLGGCVVTEGDQPVMTPTGQPAAREMFFPASAVEIIDTWDSTGLRGTASHDYAVADVFVPEHHTMWFSDPPICDHALYRMPVVGAFATYVAAVPLGIARHALDAFTSMAAVKTPVASTARLAEKPTVHAAVGRAASLISVSRATLMGILQELWDRVQTGYQPTPADHCNLWITATHSAQAAFQATEMLYATAGATGIYASSALDRCLRDGRTAVQHIVLQEANYEHYGRQLLLVDDTIPGPWMLDYRAGRHRPG